MSTFIFILLYFILVTGLCYLWVLGIDNMKKNHPNYKGEDFLGEDEDNENKPK